ncbi:hypothetical protein B7463_g2767, partial [Scytalidium lignicola]
MGASQSSPTYAPFSDANHEIRLIQVEKLPLKTRRPSISFTLRTVSLQNAPPFSALSYVWGNPKVRERVIVNGKVVSVSKNLAIALRHIKTHWEVKFPRRTSSEFFIWADALCINQCDLAERTVQVKVMGRIFSSAECVFGWLGWEKDRIISKALDLFDRIANELPHHPDVPHGAFQWIAAYPELRENHENALDAILDHNRLEYWYRVWIFQEAILAKDLEMVCPSRMINFAKMSIACNYLRTLPSELSADFSRSVLIDQHAWITLVQLLDWSLIGQIIDGRDSRDHHHHSGEYQFKLSKMGMKLFATDPKDHVYGLLGLTDLNITPDYERKSLRDVYCEYSAAWLEACQSFPALQPELMFLSHSGVGIFGNETLLPSWVPNFPALALMNAKRTPLITSGSADLNAFPFPTNSASIRISELSLVTRGVQFDNVAQIHDIFSSERPRSVIRKKPVLKPYPFLTDYMFRCETETPTRIPPLQSIFRVTYRNSKRVLDRPTIEQAIGFLMYLVIFGTKTLSDGLIDRGLELGESFPQFLSAYFFPQLSAQELQWSADVSLNYCNNSTLLSKVLTDLEFLYNSWRIFETRGGNLGLAPKGVVIGDTVCVLKGSSVPILLRRVGANYANVGPCFVLGIMNGELSGEIERGKFIIEEFKIF